MELQWHTTILLMRFRPAVVGQLPVLPHLSHTFLEQGDLISISPRHGEPCSLTTTMKSWIRINSMRITLTCPNCAKSWTSYSKSGRTRCRECGTRIYVALEVRRSAGLVPTLSSKKSSTPSPPRPVPSKVSTTQQRDKAPSFQRVLETPKTPNTPNVFVRRFNYEGPLQYP